MFEELSHSLVTDYHLVGGRGREGGNGSWGGKGGHLAVVGIDVRKCVSSH